MSTYAGIVSSEPATRFEVTGDRLVDHARSCRSAMFAARATGPADPLALLAAEIAYDRALLRLCDEWAVEIGRADFASPRRTRLTLECQLYRAGVDLHAVAGPARP
jgi:hypothetical protein